MGVGIGFTCRKCGNMFTFMDGPGMMFAVLTCNKCGCQEAVDINEVGEDKFTYGFDSKDQDKFPYMEDIATRRHGKSCGGRCTFDAPPRCERCKSTDLKRCREYGRVYYD